LECKLFFRKLHLFPKKGLNYYPITYIPHFNQGVFVNLLAVKNKWLRKVIGFGATHVAAIRAMRFGFFSSSLAHAC
jgi:hypothetical protein